MIANCPSLESPPAIIGRQKHIVSEAGQESNERVRHALEHYSSARLELLLPKIYSLVGQALDGGDSDHSRVSSETAFQASRLAQLLPRSQPIPEIAADPDGEISFDWIGPSGRMFSVSVDAVGRLAYAGRFGENSKIHGVEQLSDSCPPEIIRGIERAQE